MLLRFTDTSGEHIPSIYHLNEMSESNGIRYTLCKSIILSILAYLRSQGIKFYLNAKVINVYVLTAMTARKLNYARYPSLFYEITTKSKE